MKKLLFLLVCLSMLVSVLPLHADAALLSPALQILATDLSVTVTAVADFEAAATGGLPEGEITFTAADFEEALGVKKLDAIVITSLPSVTEGRLYLGPIAVARNQTVSRTSLSSLRFEPTAAALATLSDTAEVWSDSETGGSTPHLTSSFSFSLPDSDCSYRCRMYLLSEDNAAPTGAFLPASALILQTYSDVAACGSFAAHDPEGDPLRYTVTSSPKHGRLEVQSGSYLYRPDSGYTGTDRFTYQATDPFGNRSEEIVVTVTVGKSGAAPFDDMTDHMAHAAAMTAVEAGWMTARTGATPATLGQQYFDPELTLTRAEFLTLAMKAAGVKPAAAVLDTGFCDDSEIAAEYKGYVAAAAELGIVRGTDTAHGAAFRPTVAITRGEAAVMLEALTGVESPAVAPAFADCDTLPDWAKDAMSAVTAAGLLPAAPDGQAAVTAPLTRAETAMVLLALAGR